LDYHDDAIEYKFIDIFIFLKIFLLLIERWSKQSQ